MWNPNVGSTPDRGPPGQLGLREAAGAAQRLRFCLLRLDPGGYIQPAQEGSRGGGSRPEGGSVPMRECGHMDLGTGLATLLTAVTPGKKGRSWWLLSQGWVFPVTLHTIL